MLRGNRLYVLALGLIFVAFAAVSWLLLPQPPKFPSYENLKAQQGAAQPGGPGCEPKALLALTGDQALGERDRCAEAAQQHQHDAADLVQQTRAADGAQQAAILGYQSLLIAYLGLLFGFGTLLTAIGAVWFAKRAADAADKSVKLALDTSRAELRAYLGADREVVEFEDPTQRKGKLNICITNRGSTPAHSTHFDFSVFVAHNNGGKDRLKHMSNPMGTLAPGVPVDSIAAFSLSAEALKKIKTNQAQIVGRLMVNYVDAFGAKWIYEQEVVVNNATLQGGPVYTNTCRQHEDADSPEPKDDSPELPLKGPFPRKAK